MKLKIAKIEEKIQMMNNPIEKMGLFIELSDNYLKLNQNNDFFKTINKALSLAIKLQKFQVQGEIYNKIGLAYVSLVNFEKAIENFYHAQTIFHKLRDKYNEALSLRQLGNCYNSLNSFKQSEDFYFLALSIYKDLETPLEIGMIYNNLGTIYQKLNDISCIKYFLKAKEYFFICKNEKEKAIILSNIGEAYLKFGDLKNGEKYLYDAKKFYDSNKYLIDKIFLLHNLARLNKLKGKCQEAIDFYFEAIKLSLENKYYEELAGIYRELSQVYEKNKEFEKSLEYLKKFNAIYRYMYNTKKLQSVVAIQTQHKSIFEDKQSEINKLKHSTLKKAYEELNIAYLKLQEMQQELLISEKRNTALALAVSTNHEINQPLMVIKGTIDILKLKNEDFFQGKNGKYYNSINNSIKKISQILNKITNLDKISFVDYTPGTKMLKINKAIDG